MKLNIMSIITKLRSGEDCYATKVDLDSDMSTILESNKKSWQDGTLTNPAIKEYFESGSTSMTDFAAVFFSSLLGGVSVSCQEVKEGRILIKPM